MEVKYIKKTQIQVTYTERGNGVQMTFIQFICVPFGSEVVCTRFNME